MSSLVLYFQRTGGIGEQQGQCTQFTSCRVDFTHGNKFVLDGNGLQRPRQPNQQYQRRPFKCIK